MKYKIDNNNILIYLLYLIFRYLTLHDLFVDLRKDIEPNVIKRKIYKTDDNIQSRY